MLNTLAYNLFLIKAKVQGTVKAFVQDESGDEIFEKAAVIAAVTAGVLVIIAIGALAAGALQQGKGWFGG